jgi:fatty-acyl-CoA synthase
MAFHIGVSKQILGTVLTLYFVSRTSGPQQQGKLKTSYLSGPRDIPLIRLTLGQLLQQAADKFGDRTAAVFIHQDIRKTFHQVLVDVRISKND